MSSPNRSTKKRSVAEKGEVDNGTSAKKRLEEEERKIPGIKHEETGEVPDTLKQETGEETDALKQETDDEMDALKHETDDEMEEEDDVNSPPLPPLLGAAEGTLNADSNGDFFQAGEDGDNDFFGGDDSAGSNVHANTSQASDSYNRNGASSGGLCEAQPCVGIANPNDNKIIANWNDRYFELIEYKGEHGNCKVPQRHGPNKALGEWVNDQRKQCRLLNEGKSSAMTKERSDKLNDIGFVWKADEDAWETRFTQLVAYKEEHGNCNVSTLDGANKQLGEWVGKQRYYYRNHRDGKKSPISNERVAKLNEIGFEWDVNEAAWEEKLAELVAYKEAYGDCNVPNRFKENEQLGKWVARHRTEYRLYQEGKKAKITRERIAKLNEIGFQWDVNEAAWEEKLAELVAYKEAYGDCNVPNKFKENEQLGKWVARHRTQYRFYQGGKKSHMTEERIAKLDDIGFKWKVRG